MKAWLLTVGLGALGFIGLMALLWWESKAASDQHTTKEEWDR